MLIGGPNQSHKVNFKELFPMRERCPQEGLSFGPSIHFPNIFQKRISGKNRRSRGGFFRSTCVVWRRVLKEGRTENANSRTGYKPFLKKVFHRDFSRYRPTACEIFPMTKMRRSPRARGWVFCIQYINTSAPGGGAHLSGRRAMRFASGGCVGKIAAVLLAPPIFSRISVARNPPGA